MGGRLRVIVLTQQEYFFIPRNIIKASEVCDILMVVDNRTKGSFENKTGDMLRWFGFSQCARMGISTMNRKFQNAFDAASGYRLLGGTRSIRSAAEAIGAEFRIVKNVNSGEFVEQVREIAPDLIVSYSAPQVIKPELLGIPRYGVINVHGALLPDYRGCLPSFWYLYYGEKIGGATVHMMSKEIDDGEILNQGEVDISDCRSMFQLMGRTKELGGDLIVKSIVGFTDGTITKHPNDTENGSYYTWPTVEQAKEFRKNGKRLI